MTKQPFPSDQQDKFMLRLPDGMRERIKLAADANGRSMNAEIVGTLQKAYPDRATIAAELERRVIEYLTDNSDGTDLNYRMQSLKGMIAKTGENLDLGSIETSGEGSLRFEVK